MISIGAIFKNECPFIIEWIAYHLLLGIEDIYIADNVSTDGSSELLYYLDKAGVITRIDYATQENIPPQLGAYRKILSMIDKNRWIAFIDADEFIVPGNYEDGLHLITPLLNDDTNGAISLNWAVYGSSNSILPDDGLVIERFTKRAVEEHPVNKHYKSIVRVGDVISAGPTPHAFRIKPEKKFIMPNGVIQKDISGIGEEIDWSIIRLNHYVIKSKAEFLNKKASRGRATTLKDGLSRNMGFFVGHDLNDIDQSIPFWFTKKVKSQVEYLNNVLIDHGYQPENEDSKHALYKTSRGMGKGVIDVFNKSGNTINLKGWAVDFFKNRCYEIVVVINNSIPIYSNDTSFYDRPDLQRPGISDGMKCGFSSSIVLPNIQVSNIHIYALNSSRMICVEFGVSDDLTAACLSE